MFRVRFNKQDSIFQCLEHFTEEQVEKVHQALEASNPIYAMYVSLAILKFHPRNAELRAALRNVQSYLRPLKKTPFRCYCQWLGAWIRFAPKWAYAYFLFSRYAYDEAIYLCEEILCEYPYFFQAHQLQLLATQALNDVPTQIIALESMLLLNPIRLSIQLRLAQTYLNNNQYDIAEKMAEHILAQCPRHFEALQIVRKAIAARIKVDTFTEQVKESD